MELATYPQFWGGLKKYKQKNPNLKKKKNNLESYLIKVWTIKWTVT